MPTDIRVDFKVSYRGQSDYVVRRAGSAPVELTIRTGLSGYEIQEVQADSRYSPEEKGLNLALKRALVGAILLRNHPHKFPPADLVQALQAQHFPEATYPGIRLVGARYTADFKAIEYDGETPPKPVEFYALRGDFGMPALVRWHDSVFTPAGG